MVIYDPGTGLYANLKNIAVIREEEEGLAASTMLDPNMFEYSVSASFEDIRPELNAFGMLIAEDTDSRMWAINTDAILAAKPSGPYTQVFLRDSPLFYVYLHVPIKDVLFALF